MGGEVPDGAFKLTMRPGTVMMDLNQNRLALVLPDGSTSRSVARQSVDTYDELLDAVAPRTSRWWWLGGSIACSVLLITTFLRARRQRASKTSP